MMYDMRLSDEEFAKCRDFAKNSAPTQREYRSGGSQIRAVGLIESDTLRGKVAEMSVKNFLDSIGVKSIELDLNIYPRGVWDSQDFKIGNLKVSIKAAKWFSKWLLLEAKDFDRGDVYDIYVLVTVSNDFKSGIIKGYALKKEISEDAKTIKLRKGEFIPNTSTALDADNYARRDIYLHNSEEDWKKLTSHLKNQK